MIKRLKKCKSVPRNVYFADDYSDINRFISWFYQKDSIVKLNGSIILEIGIGNKILSDYLNSQGLKVITADFDKNLHPDYVCDVRVFPFKSNSFDIVCAFEVLEHIPFSDFKIALKELRRVTKKYVVISIPYSCTSIEIIVKFPLFKRILKRSFLDLSINIPRFLSLHKYNGEHYWVMGTKNFSKSKVKKELLRQFVIIKEFQPILNKGHYFFILIKR